MSTPAPPLPFSTARPDSPADVRARVLIVDDDPMVGRALRRILSAHDVEHVGSGHDALARFDAGARYDLVLCDLMMPEMNGPDLHRALAAIAPEVLSRFAFLTGGACTPELEAYLASSGVPVLEKPVDAAALRAFVAAHCKRSAA